MSIYQSFRRAVLTGFCTVTVLGGGLWGCSSPPSSSGGVRNTRLIFDAVTHSIGGERSAWLTRQEKYASNKTNKKNFDKWMKRFTPLKNASLLERARFINREVNDCVTRGDYGENSGKDYWASPIETALSGVGDCEDHAILKFYVMQSLGVPQSRFGIAVVSSKGGNRMDHAVLVVDTSSANDWTNCLVLDNLQRDSQIQIFGETPYRPFYVMTDKESHDVRRQDLKGRIAIDSLGKN